MRIAIKYTDGNYSFYDPSKSTFANGVDPDKWMKTNTVEISDAEWIAYQTLMVQYSLFQDRIAALEQSYLNRTKTP